ncbi:MAG: fibrillarin-like rRNA/tRNA 2'-O-methyltransferase [Candidatus Woesearchaeota archaeon]
MRQAKIFEVFEEGKKLFTKNLVKGHPVYGEDIVMRDGEYREWNPKRSKLGAAIKKGAGNLGIRKGSYVLYLGAASGTTASHVSDMVGKGGFVFGLDFSARVVRDLVFVSEVRKNLAPLLGDARQPLSYAGRVCEVDVVFQDIAQYDQAEIFMKNCELYLKKGGFGLLAVKSRSIDISKKPKVVYRDVRAKLEKKMTIVDFRELDPFEKDHCMFICKFK